MTFTIGIPYYKSLNSLQRLISAINKQNSLGYCSEVIIVNDDPHNAININYFLKERFKFNIRIFNNGHAGVAATRNEIIKLTNSDIILFLDQDCVPDNNWLVSMVKVFENNKDVQAVGGQILPLFGSGLVRNYFSIVNSLHKPIIDKNSGKIITIITGNSGFRLSALKKIRGFDQRIFNYSSHGGEDIDITYRLINAGCKIVYEPSAIVFHEYPNKFRDIFFKYANYGRGVRLFCLARKIQPVSINQPQLNIFSALFYFLKIPYKAMLSFKRFKNKNNVLQSLCFTFFEFIRFFGHGYGYFNPRYKIQNILIK